MIHRNRHTEIGLRGSTWAVTFSADGEYLVGGDNEGVRVWRVEDGEQIATMSAWLVRCFAVSKDGKWIAAGTWAGQVILWDVKTYEVVFTYQVTQIVGQHCGISGVDFSPDSTRLVTASADHTATIWDIKAREQVVGPLRHEDWVVAAKYSPKGDRVATATDGKSIRVYDSNDGSLLVDIPVRVRAWHNKGLLWSDDHLFVVSDDKIKQIEASTGSTVSEWSVPTGVEIHSCIALPTHGEFVAYSTNHDITFWDVSKHTRLGVIRHSYSIHSIAVSPDNRFIVIAEGAARGKAVLHSLSDINGSIPSFRLHPTFREPDIEIDETTLSLWKQDQLASAETSFTAAISESQNPSCHEFAGRALVRARLRQWDAAVADAEESIKSQPSVIGYIAKGVALVGKGEKHAGYRACDIAFEKFHSTHVSFLLLSKAVIVFMAGEHEDAISRLDDLIATVRFNSICHVVQAYMYLLLGQMAIETMDYEGAMQLFERAQSQMHLFGTQTLSTLSLISGWNFHNLGITIQQRLCEALLAAGHAKEAVKVVFEMINTFGSDIYMSKPITNWVSGFTQRCLVIPGSEGGCDAVSKVPAFGAMYRTTLGPACPSLLLEEWAKATLVDHSWKDALTLAVGFVAPRFVVYRAILEHLEKVDRLSDVVECLHQMDCELTWEKDRCDEQAQWIRYFKLRCYRKLEYLGDDAMDASRYDEAIVQYSAALTLNPGSPADLFLKRSKAHIAEGLWNDALDDARQALASDPAPQFTRNSILTEWTKLNLVNGMWKGVLQASREFDVPRITVYQALCECLESVGGILDAAECFNQMVSEFGEEIIVHGEQPQWILDFRYRCAEKLGRSGDSAMEGGCHDEAIKNYSAALSIHPAITQELFITRSKACMAKGLWEDAINEANNAITLDPSSPRGYETKHAALHGAGRYADAIDAFETMRLKITQSPDAEIRERHDQYISPSATRAMIRKIVQRVVRHSPRVLINTTTGHLHDKAEQASAFESLPIFDELVSSMTTRIDRARINREVKHFFRYAMLSHKWEEHEPSFQQVIHMAVYELDNSPTHDKLRMFCRIVCDSGFVWAWSDTCCINKQDHFVLQEALVAMFKWYRGSAMMIVFLRGVRSAAKFGDLMKSIWNTRAWTLQEYVAAKVIHFYTEDWTPYLDLRIPNHKESPEIISEMEQTTGVSAQQLMALCPGLNSIREKLRLASTRQTTRVEDTAYSLLGIFSVTGIPVIYGEGENALGRLLAHILAGSGDASILAWTGQSGGYNSCLPGNITVFDRRATSHMPLPVEDVEMERVVITLRTCALDLNLAVKLYDRLNELPAPWFAASRMKLPCVVFKLPPLSPCRTRSDRVYRTDTLAFGTVEFKTRQDPSRLNSLYLVHPWIDSLLDREDMQSGTFVDDDAESSSPDTDDEDMSDIDDDSSLLPEPELSSPHTELAPVDRETRALQLIARLRQPFGALLLTLASTRRRAVVYRRVAADSVITVQLRENVPLDELLENVRILDVL